MNRAQASGIKNDARRTRHAGRFLTRSGAWTVALTILCSVVVWQHRVFGVEAAGEAARTADNAAEQRGAANKKMHKAAEELKREAIEVGRYDEEIDVQPHFSRPHPALSGFGPESVDEVLGRMLKPFTGNAYEDTYVRWHMMHVVMEANEADRRKIGKQLVRLIKQMPGPLDVSFRREWAWVPERIGSSWYHLFNSLRVVTGYPPYERRYDPPHSFDHMDADTRAWAEERWKKALELKEQFETVYDDDAIAFNKRVRKVNWIVRQYRGELIYALFFTGDPEMARLIITAIQEHAPKNNGIALDLLSFWYLAAFDGALELYEPDLLEELSQKLERIARGNDLWYEYQHRQRNFADYAFHMVTMLRQAGVEIDDSPS